MALELRFGMAESPLQPPLRPAGPVRFYRLAATAVGPYASLPTRYVPLGSNIGAALD